jgi:hypothetical protein
MLPVARRILLLAIAGGVLFDVLVPGNAAGLNAPLMMGAFLATALVTTGRSGLARMDPADAWLGPVAMVLASLGALRADDWLVMIDLLLAAALAAGAIGCLAGGRITRGLVPRVFELAIGVVAASGVGAAAVLAAARPANGDDAAGAPSRAASRLRRSAPVLRGLVIAIPVVAVFVALFSSADAVFARLASDVFSWQLDVDFANLFGRALLIAVIAWGAAGLLALGAGLLPSLAAAPPIVPRPSVARRIRRPGLRPSRHSAAHPRRPRAGMLPAARGHLPPRPSGQCPSAWVPSRRRRSCSSWMSCSRPSSPSRSRGCSAVATRWR